MRVIYTAGVWDLLHDGHLRFLEASAALGDQLVVGVVTDDGAAAYKRRPIMPEGARLALIRGLACVDAAMLQPGTDPTPILELLRPDVMTHGDDWSELLEGQETLERLAVEWVILPYGAGTGTTGLIERIQAQEVV